MMKSCTAIPEKLPDDYFTKECYKSMRFDDMWEDAEMESVLEYLKGNRSLKISESWRRILMP